jgi:molybdopterin/thiamine biosynthesis adenylyltransferase
MQQKLTLRILPFPRVSQNNKYCSGEVAKTRPSFNAINLFSYLPGTSNPKAEGIKGQSICKETEFLKDKKPYRNRKYRTACFLWTFERDNK